MSVIHLISLRKIALPQLVQLCTRYGTLEAGKEGDFIAVKGKPDEDIHAMRNILAVVKDGRRVFNLIGGAKERQFHIHQCFAEVAKSGKYIAIHPMFGQELKGKVTHTIVRGKVVMENDKILAEPGFGQFVRP